MKAARNILATTFLSLCLAAQASAYALPLEKIKLPPGFKISIFAQNIRDARSLALSPNGTVYVGTREEGAVYALPDANKDGKPDKVIIIARGLNMPNGVAFRDGALYVAEVHRVLKIENIESSLERHAAPVVVNDRFPNETAHGWKYIAFGPDGLLYVPVGVPCNICISKDPKFGTMMRMGKDGSKLEIFATGLRNSVGFDWHPETKELWFTDNGRDMLGDNFPPDELNRAPKPGMNFGFPYRNGNNVADPEFGKRAPNVEFTPPAQCLGPHVASLGMHFYTGKMFPSQYRNQIFIAEHGSWNRRNKIGYRIMLVNLKGNQPTSYTVFAEGWLQGESPWGRPVALLQMPDGSLLVSDDHAGAIYRISYEGEK